MVTQFDIREVKGNGFSRAERTTMEQGFSPGFRLPLFIVRQTGKIFGDIHVVAAGNHADTHHVDSGIEDVP